MNTEGYNLLAKGLNNLGAYLGKGIAWCGFWIACAMVIVEIIR